MPALPDGRVGVTSDALTWWILLGPWVFLWLPWELWLLWRRSRALPGEPRVQTISMVARYRGWQMNSLVYSWSGMAAHWWWNAEWGATWAAVAFWLLLAAAVVWDYAVWRLWGGVISTWPRWLVHVRRPAWWLVAGTLAGRFLFPQSALLP